MKLHALVSIVPTPTSPSHWMCLTMASRDVDRTHLRCGKWRLTQDKYPVSGAAVTCVIASVTWCCALVTVSMVNAALHLSSCLHGVLCHFIRLPVPVTWHCASEQRSAKAGLNWTPEKSTSQTTDFYCILILKRLTITFFLLSLKYPLWPSAPQGGVVEARHSTAALLCTTPVVCFWAVGWHLPWALW